MGKNNTTVDPRHTSRQHIIEALYSHSYMGTPPALEKYEEGEYKDILKHKDEIDELIDSYTVTFDHTKMARVDYVILQLGMFELFFAKKKPPYKVVINEAIELSKEYGSSGSPKLVNGILGKAYESHEKR